MVSTKREIRLADRTDRWRYVCPRGHRSWEPTNFHFWCQQCAQNWEDVDPEFHELLDKITGETIPRERVHLTPREPTIEDGGVADD